MSTVVAQPYKTDGNGGRKLVRLDNGWLVAVTKTTDSFYFYADKKDGNGFVPLCFYNHVDINRNDIAIVSRGTHVYVVHGRSNSVIESNYFDATTVTYNNQFERARISIDSGQTALEKVSLAINHEGTELHAAWSSSNSTYASSNIRYAKGTINTDGSVTWGTVEQWTKGNNANLSYTIPAMCIDNLGRPIVITAENGTNTSNIIALSNSNMSFNAASGQIGVRFKLIYNGGSYLQSSPSAVVDKDGIIHVAWHGMDSTITNRFNLRVASSSDSGVTWSTPTRLTSDTVGNSVEPSITVDKSGEATIVFAYGKADSTLYEINKINYKNGSWGTKTVIASSTSSITSPSTLYDPTFEGQFGDTPPTIYKDGGQGIVMFTGDYTTNNAPTLTLDPISGKVLQDNNVLVISGTSSDEEGSVVIIKYSVNSGETKNLHSFISGSEPTSFSKSLTYKDKKLYDGNTAVSNELVENTFHTIKIWAEDQNGGKTAEQTGTFSVIWNIPPKLNSFAIDGTTISWSASDDDGKITKVEILVNDELLHQIDNPVGVQSFDFKFWHLKRDIVNKVKIVIYDSFGATVEKVFNVSLIVRSDFENQFVGSNNIATDVVLKSTLSRADSSITSKITEILGGAD